MRASFYEYNVAMSGIFTARANLNVVGHNMANSAIPGYSRQQTIQQAARPLSLYDGKGMYGTGSEVLGIKQIRDKYLDNKYWQHQNVYGEYRAKNNNLELIETVFNDLPDSGVLSCFHDYFERLQDLSTTTPDATYRTNVIAAAETLTEMIRTNAESLQKQQRDINSEVENTVTIINSLGSQIAGLNDQIKTYERDGSMANDLRDQRARLVDELSEYVNVNVEELDYSTEGIPYDLRYSVTINGHMFVNEDDVNPLMCVPRGGSNTTLTGRTINGRDKLNEMDAPGLFDIYFSTTGAEFDVHSVTLKGTLKGLIDVRDGNGGNLTEPKEAEYVTGEAGTYAGAGTAGTSIEAFFNAPNGPVTILNEIGKLDEAGVLAGLRNQLTALTAQNPKPSDYRQKLKAIADELSSALTLNDYAVKDLLAMSEAVLPENVQDVFVNRLNAADYSADLSKILNDLAKIAEADTTVMGNDYIEESLDTLLKENEAVDKLTEVTDKLKSDVINAVIAINENSVTDFIEEPASAVDGLGQVDGASGILADIEKQLDALMALDPKPGNYRDRLKELAAELSNALISTDTALQDVIGISGAVLDTAALTPLDNRMDALVDTSLPNSLPNVLDSIKNIVNAPDTAEDDAVEDNAVADNLKALFNTGTALDNLAKEFDSIKAAAVTAVNGADKDTDGSINIIVETDAVPPSDKDMYTTTTFKGIPFYMNKLNTLIRTFARSMNEGLDFRLESIPKDSNGNIVGHMYGYNLDDIRTGDAERDLRLLFTSANGVNSGSGSSDLGELSMWKCEYELDGLTYSETLTSNNDVGPDLPPGAVLTSCERMYVWENVYTLDGKEVRNVVVAGEGGPKPPDGADVPDGYPKQLSDTTIDYSSLNAFNFTVNPDLLDAGGQDLLACSSNPNLGESSNDVILGFGKIGEYNSLFREGKLLDFVIGTADHLAIDRNQSLKFEENYTEITMMTDNQRMSVSGVDINEEIMSMIKYNQMFQSCAKLVNVINQIYDTLINRLGV